MSAVPGASAGLSEPVCRIWLAHADIALALAAGVSAYDIRALASATDGEIAVEVPSGATSAAWAFLAAEAFSASLPDLRSACFFDCGKPCLTSFLTVLCSPAALPDPGLAASVLVASTFVAFAPAMASSAFAIAGDDPAQHTISPVATINSERPLALMVI